MKGKKEKWRIKKQDVQSLILRNDKTIISISLSHSTILTPVATTNDVEFLVVCGLRRAAQVNARVVDTRRKFRNMIFFVLLVSE